MALGDAYASVPEYRLWKGKFSSDDDLVLEWCLEAVSRVIDQKLNQPFGFNKDVVASTRWYGPGELIAPIATTSGLIVKMSGSYSSIDWASIDALTSTDYELLPRNPQAGWPYTDINIYSLMNRYYGNPVTSPVAINPDTYRSPEYRVQITAIHGWPEVPKAIKWATVELTAMLGGESVWSTNRIQELDQTIEASPQARSLLKDLMRVYSPMPIGIA